MVMWSILSRWMSLIPVAPDNLSSSSTEPMHTIYGGKAQQSSQLDDDTYTSSMSSLTHKGIGVPQ